jgi:hypothetical protein
VSVNAVLPLIVAAFGIAGTLGGVWLTQRRADRREDLNWTRELERERERWAREDAARTFEDRRTAYLDFYNAMMDAGEGIALFMVASALPDDHPDWEVELPPLSVEQADERLHILKIYASRRVSDLADKARTAYRNLVMAIREIETGGSVYDSRSFGQHVDEWNATVDELRAAIRKDLGVPSE